MEAAGDVAELVERDGDLAACAWSSRARASAIAGQLLLEQAELERERDQPLLRAVVQIALQSLALLLAGLDHACARAAQLLQVRLQLGLQAAVLERDPGCRRHRAQQLRLVLERRVVHQRGHVPAVPVDQRRRRRAVDSSGSSTAWPSRSA